jgi:hypothetical protein
MGMVAAQEFEQMRREIDDHQHPTGAQHARRLGDRRRRPVGVMQHLMDHHRVERRIGQRQLIHVAEPDHAVRPARPLEVDAGDRQHLARLVDAERLADARREDFEDPPGAGADIQEGAQRRQQVGDRGGIDFVRHR